MSTLGIVICSLGVGAMALVVFFIMAENDINRWMDRAGATRAHYQSKYGRR